MENITPEEREVIKKAILGAPCIVVTAHCPQQDGACHPFLFIRGVLHTEVPETAFSNRIKTDILQHIKEECGRSCECAYGKPHIWWRKFGSAF